MGQLRHHYGSPRPSKLVNERKRSTHSDFTAISAGMTPSSWRFTYGTTAPPLWKPSTIKIGKRKETIHLLRLYGDLSRNDTIVLALHVWDNRATTMEVPDDQKWQNERKRSTYSDFTAISAGISSWRLPYGLIWPSLCKPSVRPRARTGKYAESRTQT